MINKEWLAKFMVVFGYIMVAVYIGLGAMLFIPRFYPYVPANLKFAFAIFFIAYGAFRFVRMLGKKSGTDNE
jgi:hypothetical protein